MIHLRPHRALFLFVTALAVLFTSALWGRGMFMDGMMYATVSRNLAAGDGTFWDLHFSRTLFSGFHEHPPLAFWMESLFFRLFGDHFYTERIYSFVTFAANTVLFTALWKWALPGKDGNSTAWFPLLLWLSVYSITWGFNNNMLENTMMLFTSASALCIVRSTQKNRWAALALAGFCLFLAFLSKGFTGLYLWALPAVLFLFTRYGTFKRAVADSLWLLACTLLPLGLVWLFSAEGRYGILSYFELQVVKSVSSVKTTEYRTYILERWFMEMLPAICITALLAVYAAVRKAGPGKREKRLAAACIAIGFCGILPIMVSLKQRTFYINTAFMWFCFAAALWVSPLLLRFMDRLSASVRWRRAAAVAGPLALLSAVAWCAAGFGQVRRDRELLHDAREITASVPSGSILGVGMPYHEDWSLYAELYREGRVSLLPVHAGDVSQPYFISPDTAVDGYRHLSAGNLKYHLHERIARQAP